MLVVPAARGLATVAWKLKVKVPLAGTVKFVQSILLPVKVPALLIAVIPVKVFGTSSLAVTPVLAVPKPFVNIIS
ncbi:hypothetical protein D3C85_1854730 [compost metagenome]